MADKKTPKPTPKPSSPWSLGTGMAGKAQDKLKSRGKDLDKKMKDYGI